VQLAHALAGFLVRRILGIETHARLPEHERERADVARELGEREMVRLDLSALEKREVALIFGFEVVKNKAGEVGDEDKARDFLPSVFAGEVFDVGEGLRLREREVFAEALVLGKQSAFPKKVNRTFIALQVPDVLLKGSERGPAQTEDIEEVIPERLLLGALGTVARVLARKPDGAVADFVPRQIRHQGKASRAARFSQFKRDERLHRNTRREDKPFNSIFSATCSARREHLSKVIS
jgi:hypothetical protein